MSLIGFDIGTTGCKAIAFQTDGTILAHAHREYTIQTPHPTWAEQDAENVFQLAWQCLQELVPKIAHSNPPTAIALSCQGEAIIPVDDKGNPLRPAILGMDTRTGEENRWLTETFGADTLFQQTGMPVHTINTLPKLLWLKKHEPEVFNNAHQFLLYEDFFLRRLTGNAIIGHCLASRTQMYDLANQNWAYDILEKCGIEPTRLARLAPMDIAPVGILLPEWKQKLGLSNDVHFVSGGHDQACAALGSGVIESGKAMVSTGTAEVVEVAMDSPTLSDALQKGNISIYRHVVPNLYLTMTLNHSGGLLLRWFRDEFCENHIEEAKAKNIDTYDLILKDAPQEPTSLFVLPHFAGSGTPWLDTESKGAILGLTFTDNRATLAKAILEGLTFELRINLDLIRQSGIKIKELHAVGGGAKSALWLQLKADICQISLRVPQVTEAACLGAALLAGTGTGIYPNLQTAVTQTDKMKKEVEPNPSQMNAYQKRYETYSNIYPKIKELY